MPRPSSANLQGMPRVDRETTTSMTRTFDVICAGETVWHLDAPQVSRDDRARAPLVAHPGALRTAYLLAQRQLAVGLVTTLSDDTSGRALLSHVAGAGVDTRCVTLAHPSTDLLLADGTPLSSTKLGYSTHATLTVPAQWSARVLLLSGLSPLLSYAGSLCRAARAARRTGTAVVVDVNARRGVWAGHDPRVVRMVIREADVVHATDADLTALGVDAADLQASLRPSGTLAITFANGDARLTGPFGVLQLKAERRSEHVNTPDGWVATICAELVQMRGDSGLQEAAWARLFTRGGQASARCE